MSKERIKILLVEDNPADARLLQKLLTQVQNVKFTWVEVETLAEAINTIAQAPFNIILLDLLLPDSQGLETLRTIRKSHPTIPIVVLTGLDNEDIAIEALREGAQDYLVKGEIQRSWLVRSIHYAIERQRIFDRLQQLNEELVHSNQELEEFAYIASHDLQQPLTAISAITQLLTMKYQGNLDENVDQYIMRIGEGVGQMQQLIKGLLTYARVGPGEQEFKPIDCHRILDRALANLQVNLEERKADIRVEPLPTLIADEVQLIQLFQNLIGNSLKYCPFDRSPQIEIALEDREGEWCFSIRDNGIGIESEYFDRIFQMFQRLHAHDQYPGTGIGLTICKRIVEGHGGRIWLESEVGLGTVFYFTLAKELGNS